MNFRPKNEYELDRLSDDQLIAEIVAARSAGENDAARTALGVLAFRRYEDVRRRILIKVHPNDADDIASEVFGSAIKSAFDGTSVGEFVEWLKTITDRRVADHYRSRPAEPEERLPGEAGDEDDWGEQPAGDDFSDDLANRLDMTEIIKQAFGELGAAHQAVVELYVFESLSAKETADQVNMSSSEGLKTEMTEANVHQIAKRFRERLRKLLEDARGPD